MNNNYLFSEFFNIRGTLKTLKYLFKLRTLKPDIRINHLKNLDLLRLKTNNNIKYVVFDKDNTIAYHKSNQIANHEIKQILDNFHNIFGTENIAILSNTAGSNNDINFGDLNLIEQNFGIKVIKHKRKKPCVDLEIFEHFKIQKSDSKNICFIGDRLFTDIVIGKELNSFTILINPLDLETDNIIVRNIRKIEDIILKYI